MKKIVKILFIIYFTLLALVPCFGKDNCDDKCNNEICQTKSDKDSDEQNESCTPFCVCSCCAPHVLLNNAVNTIVPSSEIYSIYTEPISLKITSVSNSIWQPPRLS